ncbi:unnamed protein product [Mytilus edulis]|uniref:Uncharacterized protein n=1 Tax=Mytilus edulis TaxID=6550 RepID=A0A8S3UNL6_MYTED|nr:unnamed protein product [Mytilus edulis]
MVDRNFKLSVVVCGCLFLLLKGISTLELKSYTACYGILHENFIKPSCVTGEKMAVVGLYALAKELNTSCPIEITTPNTVPDSCCQYNPIDCSIRYVGSIYRRYYQNCNGKSECFIQVSWIVTTCNQTVYLARTNYMKMDYYCISDQVLDPCSSLNTSDDRVFLWNSGYPLTSLTGSSTCTCSIEASCNTTVRITAFDLRLGTSTTCDQSIMVTDGSTVMVIDCSDNNNYLPTTLYISTAHFIQIQIVDNLGFADGYYYLLLEGTSPGAELTLSCGSTALTTPFVTPTSLPDCPSADVTTGSKTAPTITSTDPYIGSEVPKPSLQSTKKETMTTMTTRTVVTTESTTPPFTSTKSYISSEAPISSMQITDVESLTTDVAPTNSTSSVIKDAYTTGGTSIPQTIGTSTDLTSSRKSEVPLTTSNDVKATEKTITELHSTTNNGITTPSGNITNRSTAGISNSTEINNTQTTKDVVTYSSTQPVSVSLGWTSTVQNLNITRSFSPISSHSDSSQKAHTTEIEQTTHTNVTVSVDKSSPISSPLIIGLSVAVILICIMVLVVRYHKIHKPSAQKYSLTKTLTECIKYEIKLIKF